MTKEENLLQTKSTELTKSGTDNFSQYLKEIQKFPILTREEEYDYAIKFKKNGDKEAAKMLIQSHLRLVVKIAGKFKNYGLPVTDLVAEGNLGLIQAVKGFDPEKGFRFSTYAMWWVKAGMQEYILRSWSLVKIGTTAAQKKLFFNLGKIKRKILGNGETNLSEENITTIANDLNVSKKEVSDMDSRLTQQDSSLNNLTENGSEIGDIIIDDSQNAEEESIANQEQEKREELLREAFLVLNERERDILIKRQMSEISTTLDELSKIYKISSERIRQLEQNALAKIKKEIMRLQNK